MKASTYEAEALIEATHWWFVGRRSLFATTIKRLCIPLEARVLDVGTSTGTNLRMLRDAGFARVEGLDISEHAIRWCAAKGLGPVTQGDVCNIPFSSETFDLVLATDVIEHVDDDRRALAEIHRVLKRGAYAIITVPAFGALWGLEDEASHHKRRYRANDVGRLIDAAGLLCEDSFYFNYLLFVPVFLTRTLMRFVGHAARSELEINSPSINRFLTALFRIDVATAAVIKPRFGISYLAVVQRK